MCYLGQAVPRWGSDYTGEPGSTRRSGQVRAGFCRSYDPARIRWSSPSDGPALHHSRSETRNTAVPHTAHQSRKNGPHTHIHALLEAVLLLHLIIDRRWEKDRIKARVSKEYSYISFETCLLPNWSSEDKGKFIFSNYWRRRQCKCFVEDVPVNYKQIKSTT